MLTPSSGYHHLVWTTSPTLMKSVFEDELSRVWGRNVRIDDFSIPRVLPRKDGRLLIQYCFSTVESAGSEKKCVLFGQQLAPNESPDDYASGPELIVLPRFRLLVPVFPFDRKLKHLRQMYRNRSPSDVLDGLSEGEGQTAFSSIEDVELLGYRPERRAVLRFRLRRQKQSHYIIAKLARPEKAAKLYSMLTHMERVGFHSQSPDGITVPHPVAHLPQGIVCLEEVSDPSLHDLIESNRFISGCTSTARVLNKLHGVSLPEISPHDIEDELRLLAGLTARTAEVYPQVARPLDEVLSWIENNAPGVPERAVPIHRDFYDKQVLIGHERTTLLDVDTLALGDPALDVGNFLAHLHLRLRQTPTFVMGITGGRQAFIKAYQTTMDDELFWRRVEWWETAALLRLACIYCLRPRWQDIAVSILDSLRTKADEPSLLAG